jgi:uncharacterized lipoprotein YddW (UPF0748 family)
MEPPREFRGVWVATVHNIDWPNRDSSSEQQKKDLLKLLDSYKELNLNAVIFQVRPAADAFYPSDIEPWSIWLNGKQGQAPDPFYDPLAFAIEETHKRGMEFHAWLNPYRASSRIPKEDLSPDHVVHKHPEWILSYGDNLYLDPGLPEVRAHTNRVVHDIVSRYELDAIHFDDYFYPYKIEGELFPDTDSFKNHGGSFFPDRLEDWRRENVDQIIRELAATIKKAKPWVQFGISPFGVWRNASTDPTGSETQASQTNYDDLYADVRKWAVEGWIDYVVPQAYWHIGFDIADYGAITRWWNDLNSKALLYIGLSVARVNSDRAPEWKAAPRTEIEKQMDFNTSLSNVKGVVFFNGSTFLRNPLNIVQRLKQFHYTYPALPPVVYNKSNHKPSTPREVKLKLKDDNTWQLSWMKVKEASEKEAVRWLVFSIPDSELMDLSKPENLLFLTGENQVQLPKKKGSSTLVLIAVNRNNRCSDPILLQW